MNKAIISGNVVADPIGSQSEQGVSYCRFRVAVSRKFNKDEADFLDVVCFRNTADYCSKYLEKGLKVVVCGSIQSRAYEKDGVKRTSFEIVADEVEINFKSRSDSGDQPAKESAPKRQRKELEETDDDLPF